MSQQSSQSSQRINKPYGGYFNRAIPPEDPKLTHTDPGTPMGEFFRLFWQPVCLSAELTDVPKAIRIMSEDLVAFRDREGRVGVLHRHCAHRGTSLEFGVIQRRGIRCCYHGFLWDVDGRLLETPGEPADSRLKERVCQGAYPALERNGMVFAYMGPPEKKPDFPQYDGYWLPRGTKLVPFSNVYPCNWLQVHENIMDHIHTAILHNNMTVEAVDAATKAGMNLDGFGAMPVMQWEQARNGTAMYFIATRRLDDDRVWVRSTEMVFPNYLSIGSLAPSAARQRHSMHGMTRWHVPVDNENMIIFGWRHFNDEVDPDHAGKEEECGVDKIDFLVGQTGNRSYEVAQRAPGDWEALTSQRPIAIHALENPGTSDTGVYLCRKLLRECVDAKEQKEPARTPDSKHTYAQDSVLCLRRQSDPKADQEAMKRVGQQVLSIMIEAEKVDSEKRDAFVRRRLDEIDPQGAATIPMGPLNKTRISA